jgi:Ca2+-binding RTX toxin-like protein
MTITLSVAELEQASVWYQEAIERGEGTQGAFAPFYNNVRVLLSTKLLLPENIGAENYDAVGLTIDWLVGASQTNDGVGLFGTYIRRYAQRQIALRYGSFLPSGEMNRASNAVGALFASSLINGAGSIPTVAQIGQIDLLGVRNVLFPSDPELALNQAWPGMLLLSAMGQDFIGNTVREFETSAPLFSSLLDLKNALLAFDSLRFAIPTLPEFIFQGLQDPVRNLAITESLVPFGASMLGASLGLARGDNALALVRALTEGKDAEGSRLLRVIGALGPLEVLNLTTRAYTGAYAYRGTTEASFDQDTRAFFAQFVGAAESELGVTFLPSTATQIAAAAASSVAVRNALKAMSPFEFALGDFSGRQLELYGVANRQGLTPQWIQDRALMMERYIHRAENALVGPILGLPASENASFVDIATGTRILVGAAAAEGRRNVAFGGDNADSLVGFGLGDGLYGGGGSDLLAGRGGANHLEGGTGRDLYVFESGNGQSTIVDADGQGVVARNGAILALAFKQSEDVWGWNGATFTRNGSDLEVTFADNASDKIVVRDFDFNMAQQGGYLSIRLVDLPGLPLPARAIEGDLEPLDVDPNTAGTQTDVDEFGNLLVTTNSVLDRADTLLGSDGQNGSNPNDSIMAGGGDDVIDAKSGNDIVQGGTGRDTINAGTGNDLVEAGANGTEAGDIVQGGEGADRLYADARFDPSGTVAAELAAALPAGESQGASDLKGDFLSAGSGNDFVIGALGDDVLAGGGGADILVGGAGNDYLLGDSRIYAANLDWDVARISTGQYPIPAPLGPILDFAQFNGNTASIEEDPDAGADTLYGGAGNDWMDGGAGDDFLDSGSGNDVEFGNLGNDVLLGGAGNDVLDGDHASIAASFGGDDYLDGGEDNDWLYGRGGHDILFGGGGDDYIEGNEGNDILNGGPGSDVLKGGAGKDTYVFNRGDGLEFVFDTSNIANVVDASVVFLGGEIVRSEIKFRPGSLIIDVGEGDAIHFDGFDLDDPWSTPVLEAIHFADGDVMTYEDVLEQGFDIDGTSVDEEIYGTAVTDRILAGEGNDYVEAKAGDDSVEGGTGDDEIYAGDGNDFVDAGDGADFVDGGAGDDTIAGGAGNDTVMGGDGADIVSGGEGQDFLYGNAGNDVLSGDESDDTLDGGAGDDTLTGGAGSDAYVIFGGMGADVITDGEGGETNVLQLSAGLAIENLKTKQVGDALVVSLRGLNDSVTITDYYTRSQDWVVRDFAGVETTLQTVIDLPDPYGADYIGRLWEDTRLGASASTLGLAYAIGWKPLGGNTFEALAESAYLSYLDQTTVETFRRVDPPHDILGQNTTQEIDSTVDAFGSRPSSEFFWFLGSFEAGYQESDAAFIQGALIRVLPQLQSEGQALLTLQGTGQLLNFQQSQFSTSGGVISYDTGTETILATVTYDNEILSYNRRADVTNVDTDTGNWFYEVDQVVGDKVLVDMTRVEDRFLSVHEIVAGDSDNSILALHSDLVFQLVTLIDAGAGNDTLQGDGGLLYGNSGDDVLSGARAILIGGDGGDTIAGQGSSRFVFTATETGIDAISDAAVATESYLDWYYGNLGIVEWREAAEHGGEYRVSIGDGGDEYYDTLEEAQQSGGGGITFIDPLPSSAPVIRRSESATLASLESAGVLTRDVVSFGPGIALGDLDLTVRVDRGGAP